MIERDIEIVNRLGLHARAAAKLVQLVGSYKSDTRIAFRGREINAKSIMGVMMLAAGFGSTVSVRVDGPDEEPAMAAILDLFERRFDEGQ
ncbi:HPr family phosphocarrier protein [Pseudofulvimonas gallinarii]|jgi:phosphocarrier protein HPr|uniref:Phosphocarrier protein n=1 Tax=Pseudofulvimonas gallinarii TaxID=634155 RepID=A0A4R3LM74_9GAMM|nr:HPr family phosphocarrier protein [Pseudofulvimonas gallinarii]TCT01384.1 phosphocarrier protein [Pseudofulvimonas gallinarii]THD15136.1 phosphocarrier protein HPr [Pseudofulvimonas gallinarii]